MTDTELIERLLDDAKFNNEIRDIAAIRIEQLVKERDELGRKLNTARYGQPDFAWSIHEKEMADLRAKLAKAVETLRSVRHLGFFSRAALAVLAELEGK